MNNVIKTAWLTTNRSCNNQCSWCYSQNAALSELLFHDAEKVVDTLAAAGINKIVLIGGEPTIYPHFEELLKYIFDRRISIGVVSNGIKFKDKNFVSRAANLGLTNVNISLKGVTETEYWINTGNKNGFKDMLLGYNNLIQEGISVILSYVIIDENTDRIDQLLKLAQKEKISKILFQFVKPVVSINNSSEIMNFLQMGNVTNYIYDVFEKTNISYIIEVSFPFCYINEDYLQALIDGNHIMAGCHMHAGSGIVFDTNLNVLPCNHFVGFPFKNSKVMSEKDIYDLWNSKNVLDFRDRVSCYPSEKCKRCILWDKCGGGCFTRWLYLDPKEEIIGI